MTAELRWVPVSERMPADDQRVGLKMLEHGGQTFYTMGWYTGDRWVLPENPHSEGEAVAWVALPTFTCPHCRKQTEHPQALAFDKLMMSRASCRHCGKEFLIVDDVPMTPAEYQKRSPDPENDGN